MARAATRCAAAHAQVEKHYAERQALEAECKAKGWDEMQVHKAVSALDSKQTTYKQTKFGADNRWFFEQGGLGNNFCLFFNHFVAVSTPPCVVAVPC